MTLYTVHQQPAGGSPVVVGRRFDWTAFLFGPLCLASRRLWLPAALLLGFDAAILTAWSLGRLEAGAALAALAVGALLVGLEAHEWRRRDMTRRGFVDCGLAFGSNETEALMNRAVQSRAAPNLEERL